MYINIHIIIIKEYYYYIHVSERDKCISIYTSLLLNDIIIIHVSGRDKYISIYTLLLLSNIIIFEDKYFAKSFYREVDETLAVIPKRNIAPEFYHR